MCGCEPDIWSLETSRDPPWPIGGKGESLRRLWLAGFPVPEFVALSPRLVKQITTQSISDDVLDMIAKVIGGDASIEVIVRSSATVEDGDCLSYAGVFESVWPVKLVNPDFSRAVRSVYESYFHRRRDAYDQRSKHEVPPSSVWETVLVQRYIKARVSGVGFAEAIYSDGDSGVVLEFAAGPPDGVANGSSSTSRLFLGEGDCGRLSGSLGVDVTVEELAGIRDTLLAISDVLGAPADVEWAMEQESDTSDCRGRLWILQARPISSPVVVREATYLLGLGVSSGVYEGRSVVVTEENIDSFAGGILIAEITETDFLPAMKLAGAVVTEAGGLLSHASIVSRELGIPCIVGVPDAVKRFGNRNHVRVDADAGKIVIVGEVEDALAEGQENPADVDLLFCVDDWFRVAVKGVSEEVVCEPSPRGLIVHATGEARIHDAKIRSYIRRVVGPVTTITFEDDKYLWMYEWERMQALPYVRWLLQHGQHAARQLSSRDLASFYKLVRKSVEVASEFSNDLTDKSQSLDVRLAVGEWCQAMNFLAVAVIPQGYGMRHLTNEAMRVGIDIRELLSSSSAIASNSVHLSVSHEVIEFASLLAVERNTFYQELLSRVKGIDRHFEMRDIALERGSGCVDINSVPQLYSDSIVFRGTIREIGRCAVSSWSVPLVPVSSWWISDGE